MMQLVAILLEAGQNAALDRVVNMCCVQFLRPILFWEKNFWRINVVLVTFARGLNVILCLHCKDKV